MCLELLHQIGQREMLTIFIKEVTNHQASLLIKNVALKCDAFLCLGFCFTERGDSDGEKDETGICKRSQLRIRYEGKMVSARH